MKEVSYMSYDFPVIDMAATGSNIKRLRLEKGMSVRQLQSYFGFDEPQAIYKWQRGESLPSVDNLYALGALLEVPMEHILVPMKSSLHIVNEQQDKTCCSVFLRKLFWIRQMAEKILQPFLQLSFRSLGRGKYPGSWGPSVPPHIMSNTYAYCVNSSLPISRRVAERWS
ncbi:MAG: helix-turn-helix transcriptional regulator [Firmicutes bacterium]|nr:helix-turn-helix transcriptional regulator [Bacillota bacterium]